MDFSRSRRLSLLAECAIVAVSMVFLLNGCKSKQEEAIEHAKEEAAKTGQPQTITSTDKNGNTVTTTVQPPQAGQKDEVVTTTVTPKPAAGATGGDQAAANPQPQAANPAPQTAANPEPTPAPQTPTPTPTPAPQPPPPPPPPVKLPAGTGLAIRIDQAISAKNNNPGDRFTGRIVSAVPDGSGNIVIPKGTPVKGRVDSAQGAGHFKGAADIQLRLTSLTLNGKVYPIATHHIQETQKGKGKRTAGFIGGGTGAGALIGGLAGGGKGALIGGLLGAGAGTAGAGLTGNKDLVIPAETVLNFKLKEQLTLEPEGSEPD
jgi:hypothetical protein